MTAFISIPKPCSENWNEMDATDKGAFCSKCSKEVIDCTSVKTSEIKAKIGTQKNPCVRIFSDQIDEMNFLEWFKSLTIKIQLKYAFLFAFLIVFNTNIKAQDSTKSKQKVIDSRILLDETPIRLLGDTAIYNDDFWELDSLESIVDTTLQTADSSLTAVIDSCEKITEAPLLIEEPIFPEGTMIHWLPNEPDESQVTFMGDFAADPLMISGGMSISWTEEYLHGPTPPFLLNNPSPFECITNSNELPLNNSRFSFYIEGDSLRFMSYAVEPERIRISITKKGETTPFYFNPIQIERGKSEILFPLDDFDIGAYVVTVHGEQETKAIELVYW
jgi:hypothetical protein